MVDLFTSLERKKINTLEMHKDLKKYEASSQYASGWKWMHRVRHLSQKSSKDCNKPDPTDVVRASV